MEKVCGERVIFRIPVSAFFTGLTRMEEKLHKLT